MYLKCKFAKTKKWNSKKKCSTGATADALKHMTDYPRTNSIMLPWATVFLQVHKYSVSRTWTGKGKVHWPAQCYLEIAASYFHDGWAGQSLNIDLLDGNDPPWFEQILYILVRRMQWCCQHVEKTKLEQKQSKCDEACEEEQHQVQDCEQKSSG